MPETYNYDQTNAALIQGAMQLGNSLASTADQYHWQQKAAEEANKRALEWWNMQNEYNTPKSQLSRFIDAGLNPNLIYGQMQNSNAGDIGTPKVATRESAFTNLVTNSINTALDLLRNKEQVRYQRLLNEKLDADIHFGSIGIDEETASKLGLPSRLESYKDYVGFKRLYDLGKGFVNLVNLNINKDYYQNRALREELLYQLERSTFNDRVSYARFRNRLAQGDIDIRRAEYMYRQQVNDWYKANQIFNMVDRAAGRIIDIIPFGRLGKSLNQPQGKWLRPGTYKDPYGGTEYEYRKFY